MKIYLVCYSDDDVYGNTNISIDPGLYSSIPEGILAELRRRFGDVTLINFWEI
jgi:hypothetical protein